MTDRKTELVREEDAAWEAFRAVVDPLTQDQVLRDGYYPDWSVKDLLAHVGCWDAEAARVLEQIRLGTYEGWDHDMERLNREWYEVCRDLDRDSVWAQLHAGRARMLEELGRLPEDLLERDGEAWVWFRETAVTHHDEHLPRLREWVAELAPGQPALGNP